MIRITIAAVLGVLFLAGCASHSGAPEISVEYGKIKSKTEINKPAPAGTLVAGYRQMTQVPVTTMVDEDQVAKNIAMASADQQRYVYEIEKSNGSIVKLVTEKGFFVERDCVAIEKTSLTNLRLVEDSVCHELKKQQSMQRSQAIQARQCELAKRQVILAQSDREVFRANEEVIRLCQFNRNKR